MPLKVEIDKRSGFCGGVIRAIGKAEEFLDSGPGRRLYSLGAIVHNEAELQRLSAKGLVTVGLEDIGSIPASSTIFIRAHGEPPKTYGLLAEAGFKVIDCTCPVVLKLQQSIRSAYKGYRSGEAGSGGSTASLPLNVPRVAVVSPPEPASPENQLIIFGKVGHPEVLGLLGQVDGDAVVIEDMKMLEEALADSRIRTDLPLEIFSQTTKSPSDYSGICEVLSQRAKAGLTVHKTICSQVASRHEQLSEFAKGHDVIVFVSGASSSNGKVLFELCKSRNPRTYHISSPSELEASWFGPNDSVGVCGATSTPRWLLEQVAESISLL